MTRNEYRSFSWDFYSRLLILVYAALALMRWPFLPQFIDTYYHLHTAWGFLQAGGYSSWDFWQYAPYGRTHIYPPFLHFILAFLLKLGLSKVFLAKAFEALTPGILLLTLWYFVRRNFGGRLGFFTVFAFGSSFSFFLSLFNNIPATLAIVFGILALNYFLERQLLRSALLLALAFYTHIGVPWVFLLTIILLGVFAREERELALRVVFLAVILALPVLLKQLFAVKLIQLTDISDKYFCELKPFDYLLALFGLSAALKAGKKYRLFTCFFLASFIFLLYPYRFFSAQGFLPVILLSAVFMDKLWEKYKGRPRASVALLASLGCALLVLSPTILAERREGKINLKLYLFDSTPRDILFPLENRRFASTSLWNPAEYLQAARIIRENSRGQDIIYCNYHILSACLASLSERANASGLLREINPAKTFNPFTVARIVILTKDNSPREIRYAVEKYKLKLIGENKLFFIFTNPSARAKFVVPRPTVSFWVVGLILMIFAYGFIWEGKPGRKRKYLDPPHSSGSSKI